MTRTWLIGIAVLAVACETSASIGASCTRSAECTAPLVCTTGRCHVQCRDHRDCALGARCLVGNDGLGVCVLESDRCASASECGEDFECRAEHCYDACPEGACPAGGACVDGLCERPDPARDAGAPIDANAGAGPLQFEPHVTCITDMECGSGRACGRILGGAYVCRQRCTSSAECEPSGTTASCAYFVGLDETPVPLCTMPCEIFDRTGCPDGEACDVLELSTPSGTNAIAVDCRPIDPAMLGQDASCGSGATWDMTLCAPGFDCDGSPEHACQQLCTTGGTLGDPCPSGYTCEALSTGPRFRGATLGSCDPG